MTFIKLNRLSNEYINTLPILRYDGEVVMVDRPDLEEAVIAKLRHETVVGFDTESKPSFKKGEAYPISLVQLATPDSAYLIQVKKTGFTDALADFLEDSSIKKIGVGIRNDIEKLQELRNFTAGGFIDLSKIAKEKGIIQIGLRSLTARYIGYRLVKSAQKTNWANSNLTRKQQFYAACDAWICLQIYPNLLADTIDYRNFSDEDTENFDKAASL